MVRQVPLGEDREDRMHLENLEDADHNRCIFEWLVMIFSALLVPNRGFDPAVGIGEPAFQFGQIIDA